MEWFDFPSLCAAGAAATGRWVTGALFSYIHDEVIVDRGKPPSPEDCNDLEADISRAAANYNPLVSTMLAELIEFPAKQGTIDEEALTEQYLDFLKEKVVESKACVSESDIVIENGTLVWPVYDKNDPTPLEQRNVIYIESSFASVFEKVPDWKEIFGEGLDAARGMTDATKVNDKKLNETLGYIPKSKGWWHKFTFGNGAVSGLQGICAQIIATKILLETAHRNSLRGCIVFASIARGQHAILHEFRSQTLPPDCVILSEATGSVRVGPCGIAIGQLGTTIMDVKVPGGFTIEKGARLVAEASEASLNTVKEDPTIGKSKRSAIDGVVSASEFSVKFLRTLTADETPLTAMKELERLPSVVDAVNCGGSISQDESSNCPAWKTPREDLAILAVTEAYRKTVSPYVDEGDLMDLRKHPWFCTRARVDKKSGYPIKSEEAKQFRKKTWIANNDLVMPPMFAIGSGLIENLGLPGEYVNNNILWAPVAVIARFPSRLREESE